MHVRYKIILTLIILLATATTVYSIGSTGCIQMMDSLGINNVCFNRTALTGTRVNFSLIDNVPSALGGGVSGIPIGNITNLLNSSIQCGGTDRLSNVSILSSGVSGTCSATGAGSGSGTVLNATNPWLQLIDSGTNISFNESQANLSYLHIPKSITCTGSDKLNNLTINSSGLFGQCQGDTDTNSGGTITSLIQGTNLVFSTDPITTSGTISLGSHTHPFSNLTGTLTSFGYTNLTGTASLTPPNITGLANSHQHAYTNLTGTIAVGYTNLTGTSSLTLANISAGTAPAGAFNFANLNATSVLNVTGYIEIENTATTQLRIVNITCGGIRNNGTFLIIGGC